MKTRKRVWQACARTFELYRNRCVRGYEKRKENGEKALKNRPLNVHAEAGPYVGDSRTRVSSGLTVKPRTEETRLLHDCLRTGDTCVRVRACVRARRLREHRHLRVGNSSGRIKETN